MRGIVVIIDAKFMNYYELNRAVKQAEGTVEIQNCLGQRFIGTGLADGRSLKIYGVPGNALGAYLDGGLIEVFGNVQEATGDTMNEGAIIIHGSAGDATGYSMRGGSIYIQGDVGYRAGIHMKSYGDKSPVLVIGGAAGSFLGEYQAGGLIIVLGLGHEERAPYGYFCGTGMHGGKIIVRSSHIPANLPAQVTAQDLTEAEMLQIMPFIEHYCRLFGVPLADILPHRFYALTPNTVAPYKQLYAIN